MPIPFYDEDKSEFMDRCLNDPSLDFYDPEDRYDVCDMMWGERNLKRKASEEATMPDPSKFSDKNEFVSACVSARHDEHPDEENDQSVAACLNIWREHTGEKAVDDNKVVHKVHSAESMGMEFVLSDATPDRYGDVIVADGWELRHFKRNPIALFNHNTDFPVGSWSNLRVQDGALRGHLKLAPEGTSPRIDEIRKLVDAGILRAVSVGFVPIESKRRETKNGQAGELFLKSELVETSLVSVPANPNALAVARALHISDETKRMVFAEDGDKIGVTKHRRVSPASTLERTVENKGRTKMSGPIAARIKEQEKSLVGLQDALDEHLKNMDDDNPTDEAIAITEELTDKIEKHTKQLDALRKAEKQIAARAQQADDESRTPVAPTSLAPAGMEVRTARPFAVPAQKVQPIDYMWRSLAVAAKHHAGGRQQTFIETLKSMYGEDEATRAVATRLVTRAASTPATMGGSGWADTLVQTVIGAFIEALIPYSIYPRVAGMGTSFTFGRNGVINMPARSTASALSGAFFGEGNPIPVKAGAFAPVTLTPKKLGVITTLTREISEHSTPAIEGIIRQAVLEDTGVAIDTVLTDANAATTIRPAGLKNLGGAAITASSGGGIAALIADLKALIADLIANTSGRLRKPVWIISPADVLAMSLTQAAAGGDLPFRDELSRGTLMGYPVIQSTTGTSDTMFLLDAADFMTATGDTPRFDVSDQAVLHMEDTTPLAIGTVGTPPTVAAPARSLFQTDTMAIRMIMDVNWALRHSGVVSWTESMTWND